MNAVASPRPQAVDPSSIFKKRYGNYIGGRWVEPASGQYFDNTSPVDGKVFTSVPRSNAQDIELALDAAHAARAAWGKASTTERSNVLLKIADRIEQNLDLLAHAETWDNGKPIRETLNADIPLCVDHFRYFAGAIRAQEGGISEIDHDTIAYHFHEPLGVVGQIIPWNFPLLMAVWKLAPALAAGNCVVMKPAEQTPASILVLLEVIGDLLPAGVLNVVNGFGFTGQSPSAACRSVWHTPHASIFTRMSPAPGRGTFTSSIASGWPKARTTAAFIVLFIAGKLLFESSPVSGYAAFASAH